MRPRALAIATGVLFVLSAVALATVDEAGDGASVVTEAVAATTRTGTARFALEQRIAIGGSANALTGTGQVDFGARRASVTLTPPAPQPPTETVIDGTATYVKATGRFEAMAQGKPWVALPNSPPGGSAATASVAGTGDPLVSLNALGRRGALRDLADEGPEEVRGVRVTRYSAVLDPEAAFGPQALGGMAVLEARAFVWISDDGLVRRHRTETTVGTAGGQAGRLTAVVTLELFDFGAPVRIEVPPVDQVHRLGGA